MLQLFDLIEFKVGNVSDLRHIGEKLELEHFLLIFFEDFCENLFLETEANHSFLFTL